MSTVFALSTSGYPKKYQKNWRLEERGRIGTEEPALLRKICFKNVFQTQVKNFRIPDILM